MVGGPMLYIFAGLLVFLLTQLPHKFDKEILSILHYGYEDLDFDPDVFKQGRYYNFGNYTLILRYMSIDVQSIQETNKLVWSSPIDQAFLSCANHEPSTDSHDDSFYVVDDSVVLRRCKQQYITEIKMIGQYSVRISGKFHDCENAYFTFTLSELEGLDGSPKLGFEAQCQSNFNRVYFRTRSIPQEQFFGLGEQFSYMNLKGKIFNTLVREKGVGRGDEPITTLANSLHNNAGGRYANSYMPSTVVVSTHNRSIYLDSKRYSLWDFQDEWSVNILVWDNVLKGQILRANNLKSLLTRVTQLTGRMRVLPDWINSGIVIGLQGGTQKLTEVYERLKQSGVPIAGFWLQDWVNKRWSGDYSRLWWNWELDEQYYPNWNQTIKDLLNDNVRVMTYINPMVSDATTKIHKRNLYKEGKDNGYLIHDGDNLFETRAFSNFTAGLLDITNPKAILWYKRIIKEQMLSQTGVYGFMADFGEAAPMNTINCSLYDKNVNLVEFHQTYPIRWHQLVEEAIKEYVQEKGIKDEFVFFTRAGFTQSPTYTRLVWAGDQNQNYGRHNGIQSGLVAMLSAGFSGITITHTDIGGYTYIQSPGDFITLSRRNKDILIRWLELSAFTSVFRSHEGNRPDAAIQPYDQEMLEYTRRNALIYKGLMKYRKSLMVEAAEKGIPVMRALVLEFQQDRNTHSIVDQFMLGSELLVAPILQSNSFSRRVYFPKIAIKYADNFWINVWTKEEVFGCSCYRISDAPYNRPPVFYRKNSNWARQFDNIFESLINLK